MKPTLHLVERRPAECRLTRDDVAFLLEHASHLRLAPTRQDGVYRLMPTRLVGLIDAPSVRLTIRPKFPLRSLAFLFDPESALASYEGVGVECDSFGVLDFVALRLTQRIREQVRIGLQCGYREVKSAGPYLQGRLDVSAQLRELPRQDVLHSRHDDWSADILCNRLLRSSLGALSQSPLLGQSVRPRVEQALSLLDGVGTAVLSPEAFLVASAGVPAYRTLLELAQLAAEGLMPVASQLGPGAAFLIDLERLFERWVTRGVREVFGQRGLAIREQETISLPPVQLRPDVIVGDGARVPLVVDAKWKRTRPGTVRPSDFYQAVAYAVALSAERVVLVYPGRHDARWCMSLPAKAPCVEVRTVHVTGTPSRCMRSLKRLADSLLPAHF
jgi:5-methylcytosine-specific restriction enzyme subunit McrC